MNPVRKPVRKPVRSYPFAFRAKEHHPNALISKLLIHACLYYHFDQNYLTDYQYDMLARAVADQWDNLEHMHKHLIDGEALKHSSSLYYVNFPPLVWGGAQAFAEYLKPKQ
jgi:hypothetical protein